jgi:uncharacterized protein YceK
LTVFGCSSISDMAANQRIYGGTRHNVWLLEEGPDNTHAGGYALIWGVMDFPWSLAMDTVFLPVTLVFAIARSGEPRPAAPR